ncbi:MAG: DegV family protein [Clostridia bacterium]|nr:DegV family protein [Clostridia bacterium]
MSQKVIISTDSTADISKELIEKFGVSVFPMTVVKDGVALADGVDIFPEDIFDYTRQTGKLMKTSAPNLAECESYINSVCGKDDFMIHFDISGEMSSTYANMRAAAMDYDNVFVVDSRNLSTGIGLMVLKACELRDKGLSAQEIFDEIEATKSKVDASFVLDRLDFLHKGGRCSSVAALGANLLKLKPCIEVKNGKMDVGKKYRGKYLDALLNYVKDRLADADDIDTSRMFVTHTCEDLSIVDAVVKAVNDTLKFDEVLITTAGCTVSVHCGPNTLGVLFIRKSDVK